MWRALIHLPSHLSAITALLREQNSLLREVIAAVTSRSAQTPRTPLDSAGRVSPPAPKTDRDVVRVTRQDQLARERAAQEAVDAPWRTPMVEPVIPHAAETATVVMTTPVPSVPPSAIDDAVARTNPTRSPSRSANPTRSD